MQISRKSINTEYDGYLLNICKDWERGLLIKDEFLDRITITQHDRKDALNAYEAFCNSLRIPEEER